MTEKFRWPVFALAVLLMLLGLALAGGGARLAVLGGSVYYVLAGVGLVASGVMLWRGRREGALLYLAIFALTVVWALWEVGFDGWALVPRILGPAVLAVVVTLTVPLFGRRPGEVV